MRKKLLVDCLHVLGVSQRELAADLSLSEQQVSYVVNGKRRPSRRMRRAVALWLEDRIFNEEEERFDGKNDQ